MAAGLGFKDFTTGEVLTAADVDGYLMQGVWVFASAAARDAAVTSPQEGNFAYLKDTNVTTYYTGSAWANLDTTGMTNPMTTTGDIIYSSPGSTPVRLGIGTAGQVLKVNSGATAPEWGAAAGGGKVLQVVQTTKLNTFSTNSTSFTDITDLSVSITPASASNKVLVFAFTNGSTTGSTAMINLVRDSTAIFQPSGSPSLPSVANVTSGSSDRNVSATISFLDSPSTTSATTYKVQIKMESGTQTVYVNRRADSADHAYTSSIIAMEIGA